MFHKIFTAAVRNKQFVELAAMLGNCRNNDISI